MSSSYFQRIPYKLGKFAEATSFKPVKGSFFKCLSLGLLEILLKPDDFYSSISNLKKKLKSDLDSLNKYYKNNHKNLELLSAFEFLFNLMCEAPDIKTGYSCLEQHSRNELVCESLEEVMKSLIIHINPDRLDIHYQLDSLNLEINLQLLNIIAVHYCICIKLMGNKYCKYDFIPEKINSCPILYINEHLGNFMILYKEADLRIKYHQKLHTISYNPNYSNTKVAIFKDEVRYNSLNYPISIPNIRAPKTLQKLEQDKIPLQSQNKILESPNDKRDILDIQTRKISKDGSSYPSRSYTNPRYPNVHYDLERNYLNNFNLNHAAIQKKSTKNKTEEKYIELPILPKLTTVSEEICRKNVKNSKNAPRTNSKNKSSLDQQVLKSNKKVEKLLQDKLNLQLRAPLIHNSNPSIEKENNLSIFFYTCTNYNVDVKKAIWSNIKIIFKRYSASKKKVWKPQIFFREIQILQMSSKLAESGLPFLLCYGAFLEEKNLTIILERFKTDIGKRMNEMRNNNKQFNENELKKIVSRLLDGFCMLEELEIALEQIEPRNILIKRSGEEIDVRIIDFVKSDFKLIDLPLACDASDPSLSIYSAPEVSSKIKAEFDMSKACVYSLGLLFFQLTDVSVSIKGKNNKKYQNNLFEEIKYVKYDWLRDLLNKMLNDVQVRLSFKKCKEFFNSNLKLNSYN